MATVTPTRITPENLLAIEDRPMPELIDGELVEREMGQKSDAIALLIGALLLNFVRANKLGLVNGSQGSYRIFPDDPAKVRVPDVSFTRLERLPKSGPATGHARVAPDLVVEVVSPNDTVDRHESKIMDFLAAGVPLIWIFFPETKTVMVYRGDGTIRRLKAGEVLDGEDVLPGFRCDVATLFE